MAFVSHQGKCAHRPSGKPGGDPYKGDRVRVNIRVPRAWAERFTEIARKEGVPLNELIIRWMEAGL